MTQLMDTVSGMFLDVLGTDLITIEEYFPFITKAFSVLQYTAWTILFIIAVWQLFRSFGGPIVEAENPMHILVKSALFAFLIGNAKNIFSLILNITTVPYTALMEITMNAEDFTFAGIEEVLKNGLTTFVSMATVVGTLLLIILMLSLGWNYFKLLLEAVERYIFVGILCYTSPLAFAMGGSQATGKVFQSWCRMVGSQMILLILNVWFLRAFNSSVGYFISSGGALTNGKGNIFIWMFCILAFLKIAQRCGSYLASIGLSVAQTGSNMGMEMLVAARALCGFGISGLKGSSTTFHKNSTGQSLSPSGNLQGGFLSGFVSKFKPNSYVRDAVTEGGSNLGVNGGVGFVGRAFGSIAARNGAILSGESISSVALKQPNLSGKIAGKIADDSLPNYMPQLSNHKLSESQITGGHISTVAVNSKGKSAAVDLFNVDQYHKPEAAHSIISASDGSQWYQIASGDGMKSFYSTPSFSGDISENQSITELFPSASEGTILRTVDEGILEASQGGGDNSLWYNSAFYQEPDAPHSIITSSDGMEWYSMQPHAAIPEFETGSNSLESNQLQFQQFMPGYTQQISSIDTSRMGEGMFEVRHPDGTGTEFYDKTMYITPRGDYQTYEDKNRGQWYAITGSPTVERKPVFQDGKPIYDGDILRTINVDGIKYKTTLTKFEPPEKRIITENKIPKQK